MLPDFVVYLQAQQLTASAALDSSVDRSADAASAMSDSNRRGNALRRWTAVRLRLLAGILEPERPSTSQTIVECG